MSLGRLAIASTSKCSRPCQLCQRLQRGLGSSARANSPRQYTLSKRDLDFRSASLNTASSSQTKIEETSTSSPEAEAELPWYIDQAYIPRPASASQSLSSQSPPEDFPTQLHDFYKTLSGLPFFKEVLASQSDSGVWPWTVVCVLREGRERNIRAAAGRVRDEVCLCSKTTDQCPSY